MPGSKMHVSGSPWFSKGLQTLFKTSKNRKTVYFNGCYFLCTSFILFFTGSQLQSTNPSQGEVSPHYTVILHELESPSYVFDIIQIIAQPAFPGDFMYNQKKVTT